MEGQQIRLGSWALAEESARQSVGTGAVEEDTSRLVLGGRILAFIDQNRGQESVSVLYNSLVRSQPIE